MDIKDVKTAELVKKYNFKFSKSLGQNFLIDDSVPRDIVAGAEVDSEDLVIEIGPGVGTLTAQLLKKAKKVVAIELDNDLISILEQELGDNPNFMRISSILFLFKIFNSLFIHYTFFIHIWGIYYGYYTMLKYG